MGPSYANLFVGFIEHQFFSQYQGPKPNSTAVTLTTASALPPLPARLQSHISPSQPSYQS